MVRAFVTGWPVSHSRSPIIHGHWLEEHGIEGSYIAQPCEPDQLSKFLNSLEKEGFAGGNVTLPHKEAAYGLVDRCDEAAQRLGAVNTIWLEDGRLCGGNTDGYGFLANLDEQSPGWSSPERMCRGALVLGAGGAARAIVDALLSRGFPAVFIANRTIGRARDLAEVFGSGCRPVSLAGLPATTYGASLVVNTTSVGMSGGAGEAESPISLDGFDSETIVNDIVYSPLHTPLLKTAADAGLQTVDGLGMLLHQAAPGFERWFGVRPDVTTQLRQHVLRDLGEV